MNGLSPGPPAGHVGIAAREMCYGGQERDADSDRQAQKEEGCGREREASFRGRRGVIISQITRRIEKAASLVTLWLAILALVSSSIRSDKRRQTGQPVKIRLMIP